MSGRHPPPLADASESEAVRLARWMQEQAWNRDGADKTWVLRVMRHMEAFFQQARRLPGIGPAPHSEA